MWDAAWGCFWRRVERVSTVVAVRLVQECWVRREREKEKSPAVGLVWLDFQQVREEKGDTFADEEDAFGGGEGEGRLLRGLMGFALAFVPRFADFICMCKTRFLVMSPRQLLL